MADNLLARIIRQNGNRLIDKAVDRLLPEGEQPAPAHSSIPRKIAGAALLRIATRSVPGAIIVGGGLLAKHLHDRRKATRAAMGDDAATAAGASARSAASVKVKA